MVIIPPPHHTLIQDKGKCGMKVQFSRHARRRAKLYKISETIVEEILRDCDLKNGEHEIISNISGFKYPIKIVVAVEDNIMTVITNYPLKKGKESESTL
jgi:hypothetical protein